MLLAGSRVDLISWGRLTVVDASGRPHRYDSGTGPEVVVRLHDRSLHYRLMLNPQLLVGEAYMEGALTIERGSLYDFLEICTRLDNRLHATGFGRVLALGRRWLSLAIEHNRIERARRNVEHHYDLSTPFYDLFLDQDRQYSCAYFAQGDEDLDQAQLNKKRHLAAKLRIMHGSRILDIGSGWGGLALYLASFSADRVVGVTLSKDQLATARQRAEDANLDARVHFELADYRELGGCYDRIVSVGMFEHVGVRNYRTFFAKIYDLLADDGIAVLHSIGRMHGPGATNPWIKKYIFPGGYSPALSEVLPAIEKSGLLVTDIEILRLHYAKTLRIWRQRFAANRKQAEAMYDERFCRMWEFYLTGCELAFRHGGHMVFQIQLAKRQDALPLTRDYITSFEQSDCSPIAAE